MNAPTIGAATRRAVTPRSVVARAAAAASLATLLLGACSSDTSKESSITDTAAPTAPPQSSLPLTTSSMPTSSTEVELGGWQTMDPSQIDGQVALPCCGDDFHGTPSPPLPADGAPLLDGDYFVRMEWPSDPSDPLVLQLFRFESCAVLPEDTCGDPEGADNMGVDFTTAVTLTVEPDDADIDVVLVGFRGFDSPESAAARGSVADLRELITAVDAAIADVFTSRLEAGEDPNAIVDDVIANPTGGFTPAPDGAGLVVFEYAAAPPILFQVVFDQSVSPPLALRGADALGLNAIAVRDGRITLMVYAGFYS